MEKTATKLFWIRAWLERLALWVRIFPLGKNCRYSPYSIGAKIYPGKSAKSGMKKYLQFSPRLRTPGLGLLVCHSFSDGGWTFDPGIPTHSTLFGGAHPRHLNPQHGLILSK
jgi:hypothetical protein